jgi:hypothetical protein
MMTEVVFLHTLVTPPTVKPVTSWRILGQRSQKGLGRTADDIHQLWKSILPGIIFDNIIFHAIYKSTCLLVFIKLSNNNYKLAVLEIIGIVANI